MSLRYRSEALQTFINSTLQTTPVVFGAPYQNVYIYRMILGIGPTATRIRLISNGISISATWPLAANGLMTIETPINMDAWFASLLPANANGNGVSVVNVDNNGVQIAADFWYLQEA